MVLSLQNDQAQAAKKQSESTDGNATSVRRRYRRTKGEADEVRYSGFRARSSKRGESARVSSGAAWWR